MPHDLRMDCLVVLPLKCLKTLMIRRLRSDLGKRKIRTSDLQIHFGNFRHLNGFKVEFLGMLSVAQLRRGQSLRKRELHLA